MQIVIAVDIVDILRFLPWKALGFSESHLLHMGVIKDNIASIEHDSLRFRSGHRIGHDMSMVE